MAYNFYKLKNGVRVILIPMQGVQSTAVGVFVETGSRYETPGINGLSHFLEHMVFKGTKKFPTHQDTSYLEGLGAVQNAWTDVDATSYWCKVPADRWHEGLELVKELALYPTIPEKDLEIERGVIIEEINRREDRPDEMAGEVLQGLMFDGNPLGMTVLGQAEVIKTVSRDDFMEYHNRQYVAGRIVVALAGKTDEEAAKKAIEDWFGGLPTGQGSNFEPVKVKQEAPKIKVYRKDLASQVHMELAVRGVNVSDPRRFSLALITSYLGQGLSSRLFVELREKRGLCYVVHASDEKWVDTGVWSVHAGLNIEKLEAAIAAIWAEEVRIKNRLLTDKELSVAKEKIRGPLLFAMENPVHQMNFYAKQVLDRPEEIFDFDTLINKLMQIDAGELQKTAQELLVPETVNLAIVGPVDSKREQELQKILESWKG